MDIPKYILLTVDVEDWFQVENFRPWIPFETWDQYELRVEKNVHRLLDLFDSFEIINSNGGKILGSGDVADKTEELENFRCRRIGCSHFHPENEDEQKKNPQNPVNPFKKNKKKIRATFFILGWIAERLPHLVCEIHSRGHEIASHGYNHIQCNQQSKDDVKIDLTEGKKKLEDIIGTQISGFRAPNFSIDNDILKIIEDCGFLYDSSYNSFGIHGRYGQISINGKIKKGITHKISDNFIELPISNLTLRNPMSYGLSAMSSKRNDTNHFVLPWGGGAYFRLMPFSLFKRGVKNILKKASGYIFYIHPWELDPEQPRVEAASYQLKFRHYKNIRKTALKLSKFINEFQQCRFATCYQYLAFELPSFPP